MGQPFEGITVVELGQFVAVPYCAQLLADGGAHVIKVEPLEGEPTRHLGPLVPGEGRHWLVRNRGKHSLPLDLRHPRAAGILDRLLTRADVVLMNMRPGLAASLGLNHATLAARFPRLISGNVTAFGREGPDAALPGMDLVVAARTGLMAAGGRMAADLPAAADTPLADYMCAVLLAFGVSSALFDRERTGRGSEVSVSLMQAALALLNNLMVRVEDADGAAHRELAAWLAEARAQQVPVAEQLAKSPTNRTASMLAIYYRTYATADGAIAVACVSAGLQRTFMRALGLERQAFEAPPAGADPADRIAALQRLAEERVASKTTAEWKEILDAAGAPASPVFLPLEMLDDPQAHANRMLHDVRHPALGDVRVLAPPLDVGTGGFRAAPVSLPLGAETRALLAAAGFDAGEIEAAIGDGAVFARDENLPG